MDKDNTQNSTTTEPVAGAEVNPPVAEPNKAKEQEAKTFTQAELDEIINKRMAKEREKASREKAEAERLAKLSEQEKLQEELERYKQKDIENSVLRELSSNNISIDFIDFLKADTLEKSISNINAFKAVYDKLIETKEAEFNNRVEEEVTRRISGKTPVTTTTKKQEIKHDFSKMKLSEISDVLNKNKK